MRKLSTWSLLKYNDGNKDFLNSNQCPKFWNSSRLLTCPHYCLSCLTRKKAFKLKHKNERKPTPSTETWPQTYDLEVFFIWGYPYNPPLLQMNQMWRLSWSARQLSSNFLPQTHTSSSYRCTTLLPPPPSSSSCLRLPPWRSSIFRSELQVFCLVCFTRGKLLRLSSFKRIWHSGHFIQLEIGTTTDTSALVLKIM